MTTAIARAPKVRLLLPFLLAMLALWQADGKEALVLVVDYSQADAKAATGDVASGLAVAVTIASLMTRQLLLCFSINANHACLLFAVLTRCGLAAQTADISLKTSSLSLSRITSQFCSPIKADTLLVRLPAWLQ